MYEFGGTHVLLSLCHMPGAESLVHIVALFYSLKNCQNISQSGLYKKCTRIFYYLSVILANSEGTQWCFIVVFICILVITNDVLIGHFYIFFWTSIYLYPSQIFKLRYFGFLLPSCACYLPCILPTSPSFNMWLAKFFTHSVGCFSLFK